MKKRAAMRTVSKMGSEEKDIDLEVRAGVKPGFFKQIVNEDDWSFIIKLHAFFEAICTHLLVAHFQEPELIDVISRLELGNKNTGKVAFLSKCGLIGDHNKKCLFALSEIRNSLVHDIRNAEFTLVKFISELDANQFKQFAISFSPAESMHREIEKRKKENPKFKNWPANEDWDSQSKIENVLWRARNDPKMHIWIGAHSVLTNLINMEGYSDYKHWERS